jgi:quinoprotein glucose dehydrogenase
VEAIVAPSRQIAEGFETRVVATTDGQIHVGVLKAETPDALKLMTAEGKSVVIPRSDIEEQKKGESAMPEDLMKMLTKSELRDLVEFLAHQRAMPAKPSEDETP